MKNLISKLVILVLLTISMNANGLFLSQNQNDDIVKMQAYFDNIINQMVNDDFISPTFISSNISYPKTDIQNLQDSYLLRFELAGMDKNDIKLSINDEKMLVIEGEKKYKEDNKSNNYLRKELFYGKFKRIMNLPKDANINHIKSKFKNGILEVTIKKIKSKKLFYKNLIIN